MAIYRDVIKLPLTKCEGLNIYLVFIFTVVFIVDSSNLFKCLK